MSKLTISQRQKHFDILHWTFAVAQNGRKVFRIIDDKFHMLLVSPKTIPISS